MSETSPIAPGFSIYACVGKWARPHFRWGHCSGGIVLGWLAVGWMKFDVDCTLGAFVRREKKAAAALAQAEGATVDAQLRLAMLLDDWQFFRSWLVSHSADEPFELPDDVYILEHYLREHGVPDAECQCDCGSRDCEGCGVRGCNGGWQLMHWFGRAHEMSGWMFYEVLGRDIDLAKTWGEAVELFDAALAEVNWYRDDEPETTGAAA